MGIVVAGLVLLAVVVAIGFLVPFLWAIAAVVAAVWLLGFACRSGSTSRWYRW
jgi:hypothetical protein